MAKRPRLNSLVIYGGIVTIVVVIGLGFFVFVVQASHKSKQYSQGVRQSAVSLNASFKKLAKTTQLGVFSNPDATNKTAQLDSVLSDIAAVKSQLADFKQTVNGRQSIPHTSLSAAYRNANITQGHAIDITDQSNDVLDQYQQLALFLKSYYKVDDQFTSITTRLNSVSNLDSLSSGEVYGYGSQLASLANQVSKLKTPAGYSQLTVQAAPIYRQASQGANTLAYGLTIGNDYYKNSGIQLIEEASNAHDDKLTSLPTNQAQTSYILTQVNDLPDKTDGIITAANSGY